MSKPTFSIGGVHPHDSKISRECAIQPLPIAPTVYISVAQHIGAPAVPCVAVGDKVKVGQVILGFRYRQVHRPAPGPCRPSRHAHRDCRGGR